MYNTEVNPFVALAVMFLTALVFPPILMIYAIVGTILYIHR